jgi:hypothetical protein
MRRTVEEGFRDFLSKLSRASGVESDAAKKHRASIEACLCSTDGLCAGRSRIAILPLRPRISQVNWRGRPGSPSPRFLHLNTFAH